MIGGERAGYVRVMTDDTTNPQEGDPEELLDVDAASRLLDVPAEQVHAMSDQGLITARESADGPRFQRAELIAARDVGG